jgi:hypothetical protein
LLILLGSVTAPVAAMDTTPKTPASLEATTAATETVPATGTFAFSTANGILPTWTSDDIVIVGVSPGSVVTATSNLSARVFLPIVAKTGSANAAAGGFRINNVHTGASIRCSSPTIDTRAMVVDCVLADGTNAELLVMDSIESRSQFVGSSTVTTIYRGVQLRLNGQKTADMLNEALDTTAFSPYVIVGTGDLVVTRNS